MAERGKPGHIGGVEWVSAGREMFKGGRGVDRLPEDDDVDHDAEAVELVFLPDLLVLAELAALPVEDVAGPASCGEPPTDLRIGRRLHNLNELQDAARAINDRLLHTERAGQGCVLANPVFERIAHPSVTADGRRATAMRFGDSRVQALAGALCQTTGAVTGITSRSLRALMTGLLGTPYSMAQASYDLARLASNQLIIRRPHASTYDLTPDGLAFAIFYTKVHDRVLAPLFTAGQPPAPPQLREALQTIERHIDQRLADARLPAAA